VNHEQAPAAEFQARIAAVVSQRAGGLMCRADHPRQVAEVVAVHRVHRQAELQRRIQRIRPDDVATVQNRPRTPLSRLRDGRREPSAVIVAVRDHADLHRAGPRAPQCMQPGALTNCSRSGRATVPY